MVVSDIEKVDTFYENKTVKYLSHSLNWYGGSFKKVLRKFGRTKFMGIADEDKRYSVPVIHLVFKIENLKLNDFNKALEELKLFSHLYLDDYHLGGLQSRLHCFVIKIPPQAFYAYEMFLEGSYSKMYTRAEINSLFTYPKTKDQYTFEKANLVIKANNVCLQVPQTKLELEAKISGDAGWITLPDDAELDDKPKPSKEILNYKSLKIFR